MWDGLLRSSKWRCTKADFSSYSETFMLDFLHVTPGWIIGYLSSLQGYEGSLIKLTSKQVRCLHHCFNAILNKLAGCVGTSFLFNSTRHRNSYFIRIIILWRQNNECDIWRKWWCLCVCQVVALLARVVTVRVSSLLSLPACRVCNLWQSVWSWSCKKCTKCKQRLVFTVFCFPSI